MLELEIKLTVSLAAASSKPTAPAHAPGFESVNWFGVVYSFTPKQRVVIGELWKAWEKGYGMVDQGALLELAESGQLKLRDLFEQGRHPAWGPMIAPGQTRGGPAGCYFLKEPGTDPPAETPTVHEGDG